MSHTARFTLSIPNGGTDTPALSTLMSKGALRSTVGNCTDMELYAPAALTAAVTVQISSKYGSGVWKTLQSGGSDVALVAGKSIQVPIGAFEDLRFHSAGAEGAQRDIDVVFQITMGQ